MEDEELDGKDVFSGDFVADAQTKWQIGRRRYGPRWVGSSALRELYKEMLDSYNYAGRALEEEDVGIEDSQELERLSRALGEHVFRLIETADARRGL